MNLQVINLTFRRNLYDFKKKQYKTCFHFYVQFHSEQIILEPQLGTYNPKNQIPFSCDLNFPSSTRKPKS